MLAHPFSTQQICHSTCWLRLPHCHRNNGQWYLYRLSLTSQTIFLIPFRVNRGCALHLTRLTLQPSLLWRFSALCAALAKM